MNPTKTRNLLPFDVSSEDSSAKIYEKILSEMTSSHGASLLSDIIQNSLVSDIFDRSSKTVSTVFEKQECLRK
jgi:hypothetical protein